jgi:glycosyltransferase involved in cell wall biosynthesis
MPSSTESAAPDTFARSDLPAIAMVTPSYNKARFIDKTLSSVLDQNYPALQYVVMDGGSTDGSVEIIRRYADRLYHWQTGPDGGQYASIADGFSRTDAPILGWLNADDMLAPWTLHLVGRIFRDCPGVEWITSTAPLVIDADGVPTSTYVAPGFTANAFFRGENLLSDETNGVCFIQQESTFWRRSLWERAGGCFDPGIRLAGDFELWSRFFLHATLYSVDLPIGLFRSYGDQISVIQRDRYVDEAKSVLRRFGPIQRADRFWVMDRATRGVNVPISNLDPWYEPVGLIRFHAVKQRYIALFSAP